MEGMQDQNPKHARKLSLFATQPRNMLKDTFSESQQSRNIDIFDSKSFAKTGKNPTSLKRKISIISKQTKSLQQSKLKKKMRILEQKRKQKELEAKLEVLNKQRNYYKKYLICMHILKNGLLKLSYHFYFENLSRKHVKVSNKPKKDLRNKLSVPKVSNRARTRSNSPRKGNKGVKSRNGALKQKAQTAKPKPRTKFRILLPITLIKSLKTEFLE